MSTTFGFDVSSRATELTVRSLAREVRRLDFRYLDKTAFLIGFTECHPGAGGVFAINLHIHPCISQTSILPLDLTNPVPESDTPILLRYVEHPRALEAAGVRHLAHLEMEHPVKTTLCDLLDTEYGLPSLFDLFGSDDHTGMGEGIYRKRLKAFNDQRNRRWKAFAAASPATTAISLSASDRNLLDDLLFHSPDVIALTMPLLGSPVLTAYLSVNISAYADPGDIVPDFYLKALPGLSSIALPNFLNRLASLATSLLTAEERQPEDVACDFLFRSAGLLLAKSVSVPSADGDITLSQPWLLERFPAHGVELNIRLPREWSVPGDAVISLPAYDVISPSWDFPANKWRVPSKRLDAVEKKLSSDLPGVDEDKDVVTLLLQNLVVSIYTLAAERYKVKRQRRSIGRASEELQRLKRSVVSGMGTIDAALALEQRQRLRRFIDTLPVAMSGDNAKVADATIALWETAYEATYDRGRDFAHFLRAAIDPTRGSVPEQCPDLLALFIAELHARSTRSDVVHADWSEKDSFLAKCFLQGLLNTRLVAAGNSLKQRSILGWLKEENIRTSNVFRGGRGERALKLARDYCEILDDAPLMLASIKGSSITVESLEFGDGVPKFVLPASLFLLGLWDQGREKQQSVRVTACQSDQCSDVLVTVIGDAIDRDSEYNYGELIGQADVGNEVQINMESFGNGLALINKIYWVKNRTEHPAAGRFHLELVTTE